MIKPVRIIEWQTRDWTKIKTYIQSTSGQLVWQRTDLIHN